MFSTKLTTQQRIQIGLVLAMAFLLVLGSNRLDQRHFSTVQTTVNSVYDDRVVVQDFIYQLNNIFHQKELRLVQNNEFKVDATENQRVEELLTDFGETQLTSEEAILLKDLNSRFTTFKELEQTMANSQEELEDGKRTTAIKELNTLGKNLDGLAEIQLEESNQLTQRSKKSLGMNILLSKLEVAFLVIIGIAMLTLIFQPVKTLQTVPEKDLG